MLKDRDLLAQDVKQHITVMRSIRQRIGRDTRVNVSDGHKFLDRKYYPLPVFLIIL
jgi:hypothetical protein